LSDELELGHSPAMTWKWEVSTVTYRFLPPSTDLEAKCAEGWEPFGVALTGPNTVTVWIRRQVEVPYEKSLEPEEV
jgi:hypothetical protein